MNNTGLIQPPTEPLPFPPYNKLVIEVSFYSIGFIFASVGNVTMFLVLVRNMTRLRTRARTQSSNVFLLLLNLNVADLIVTFVHMPHKIVLSTMRDYWMGPSWLCPLIRYLDVFGLYLSSNVLICMSLDRLIVVTKPFYRIRGTSTWIVNVLLILAWLLAFTFSIPQVLTFEKLHYPAVPYQWYAICGTKLIKVRFALANTILSAVACYILPAATIIICYGIIICKIVGKDKRSAKSSIIKIAGSSYSPSLNRSSVDDVAPPSKKISSPSMKSASVRLHKSSTGNMRRAKNKTLRMTIAVVSAFMVCWTPYFVTIALDMADRDFQTAQRKCRLPAILSTCHQSGSILTVILFCFAIFNTVFNPYLYGFTSFKLQTELMDLGWWLVPRSLAGACGIRIPNRRNKHIRGSTYHTQLSCDFASSIHTADSNGRKTYRTVGRSAPASYEKASLSFKVKKCSTLSPSWQSLPITPTRSDQSGCSSSLGTTSLPRMRNSGSTNPPSPNCGSSNTSQVFSLSPPSSNNDHHLATNSYTLHSQIVPSAPASSMLLARSKSSI